MKIYDCFMLNDEIDLCIFRMAVLTQHVDYFVVCEAEETFTGIKKTAKVSEMLKTGNESISLFKEKIISVSVEKFPEGLTPWQKESHQRNSGYTWLKQKNKIAVNDVILMMDVDEIPNEALFLKIRENKHNKAFKGVTPISMWLSYFYCNYIRVAGDESEWMGPFLMTGEVASIDCHQTRKDIRSQSPNLLKQEFRYAGWHFSYNGDIDFYKRKLRSFSHQEKLIQSRIDCNIDEVIQRRTSPFDDQTGHWAVIDLSMTNMSEYWRESKFVKDRSLKRVDALEIILMNSKRSQTFSLEIKIKKILILIFRKATKAFKSAFSD